MTKQHKQYLILGAGALALWWFYTARRAANLTPGAPAPIAPAGGVGIGGGFASREPAGSIDSPEIVAARGAATGPLSRKACALPNRWIKTVSPPYYGFCVTQDQFDEWNRLHYAAGKDPYFPTDAIVRSTISL